MSQNNQMLLDKGLPVLDNEQKDRLRRKWQSETWDDMIKSFNNYGKYIMLRPTGFGKTYTCACACNIGETEQNGEIILNDGTIITNPDILNICNKKVIFVYVSEILKNTFEDYERNGIIKNNNDRIIYQTYSMLAKHWDDRSYLENKLKINEVGLIIFDEVQRMGARETAKALEVALPIIEELGIYYMGATATVERTTGYDVCDRYFTYKNPNGATTYCWGEHIYTLDDTFQSGLIIPPEYQYIEENEEIIKEARETRLAMIQELNIKIINNGNSPDTKQTIANIQELERARIKNSSKIVHDTMLELYQCGKQYLNNAEELNRLPFNSLECPQNLPKYMRFLVFTPSRESITEGEFGGILRQTKEAFEEAFGRYGYNVRTTIISYKGREKGNVRLLDANRVTEDDIECGRAVLPEDMMIDLIFSINMLNVGYHVEHITGLIFKRWTGSNQVFYQQLGRCLSVKNDNIPVVFDFVKSIDSRGIKAPLFTVDKKTKEVIEYADGTSESVDKTASKKYSNVDPRKCNTISSHYITVSMTSASVDDIMQRINVYKLRSNAIKLFETSYKRYAEYIEIDNGRLVSDASKLPLLRECLRLTINKLYKKVVDNSNELSLNFKAYLEYLGSHSKHVFITYTALKAYVDNKDAMGGEINSIFAVARKKDSMNGIRVNILINQDDVEEFKQNTEVLKKLKEIEFTPSKNIVIYTL